MTVDTRAKSAEVGRHRAYRAYRHSGVEWLGQIPAHWCVRRLKELASVRPSNVDKKSLDGESPVRLCNYTDVYYHNRITPDMNFMAATASPEQIRRFRLQRGDVLITKDSESWDDIAVPSVVEADLHDVLCGYHLALLRPTDAVHGPYLARLLGAPGPREQFRVAANGITRFGLGEDAIAGAAVIVPPLPEQHAIAAFLNEETIRLDTLVAKKERLIELLQEKRIALITRAVTKGVDPTVPMKDSGIEWLGKIPAHWRITRLRYGCSLLRDGTHQPPQRVVDGYPLLSVRNIVEGNLVRLPDDSMISEADFRALERSFAVRENDVLLAIVGATLGKVAVVGAMESFTIQRSLAVLRVRPELLLHEYLARFLEGRPFQDALWTETGFSAQPGIYLGTLAGFHLPIPPLGEQAFIIDHIRRGVTGLDGLVCRVREAIARLKELRNAVISAAVTGKIDVREEAA